MCVCGGGGEVWGCVCLGGGVCGWDVSLCCTRRKFIHRVGHSEWRPVRPVDNPII